MQKMKERFPGITQIMIWEEIRYYFITYIQDHQHELSDKELAALTRYAENTDIMKYMENVFFREWQESGRKIQLNDWAERMAKGTQEIYS